MKTNLTPTVTETAPPGVDLAALRDSIFHAVPNYIDDANVPDMWALAAAVAFSLGDRERGTYFDVAEPGTKHVLPLSAGEAPLRPAAWIFNLVEDVLYGEDTEETEAG